ASANANKNWATRLTQPFYSLHLGGSMSAGAGSANGLALWLFCNDDGGVVARGGKAVDGEEADEVGGGAGPQVGRAATRPGAPRHAVEPGPGLVLGLAHGPAGGHDVMASVVLYEIFAARPVLGVANVEQRAERLPAVMGAGIDPDLDAAAAGSTHALGIVYCER